MTGGGQVVGAAASVVLVLAGSTDLDVDACSTDEQVADHDGDRRDGGLQAACVVNEADSDRQATVGLGLGWGERQSGCTSDDGVDRPTWGEALTPLEAEHSRHTIDVSNPDCRGRDRGPFRRSRITDRRHTRYRGVDHTSTRQRHHHSASVAEDVQVCDQRTSNSRIERHREGAGRRWCQCGAVLGCPERGRIDPGDRETGDDQVGVAGVRHRDLLRHSNSTDRPSSKRE